MVEECFDDSAVVSNINFNFILIGKQYECKIKLFGKPVDEKTNNSVICTIINKNIIIGKKPMVEVQVNGNKYYIARQKVKEYLGRDVCLVNAESIFCRRVRLYAGVAG